MPDVALKQTHTRFIVAGPNRPQFDSLILAFLAITAIALYRLEHHALAVWALVETGVLVTLPALAFLFVFRMGDERNDRSANLKLTRQIQTLTVLYALLPVMTQLLSRCWGYGDSVEVVMLMVVQYAAWSLTVFSARPQFRKTAFVMFSAAMLVVNYMSQQTVVSIFVLIYFAVALWWLMGSYWSRIATKALDGESTTLSIRWSFFAGTAGLVAIAAAITWSQNPNASTTALAGFMPTSGGNRWQGEYARSGLGDGDMLIGGENATTAGPVESEEFIEDGKRSIYDMMTDEYEAEVVKKRDKSKAAALSGIAKHIHTDKQSEQSGKRFRTVRKRKKDEPDRSYDQRRSEALMYVEGSVPVRFALATFNHFDGWDWTNQPLKGNDCLTPRLTLENESERPWYVIQSRQRDFLRGYRCHKMKILRLKSETLPSPAFLKSWHIPHVNVENMFQWGNDGLVDFAGAELPAHTLIDTISSVPNYIELRDKRNLYSVNQSNSNLPWLGTWMNVKKAANTNRIQPPIRHAINSTVLTSLPDNSSQDRIIDLANRLTSDCDTGFCEVEAIIQHFRNRFVVDPTNVPPENCEDSVAFLLENGRGPGYLIASAACQVLRAAGYKTRLASGLLVLPEDYVAQSGQSIVTQKNLHVWPEVCLEGWHWIPVEPNPNCPLPFSRITWLQRIAIALGALGNWIGTNPFTSMLVVLAIGLSVGFRLRIAAWICWCAWWIGTAIFPRRRLQITRWLIDARFRYAGLPRPAFVPIANWFSQIGTGEDQEFCKLWQSVNFSSRFQDRNSELEKKTSTAIQSIATNLTYKKIRQFVKLTEPRRTTTSPLTLKDVAEN